MAVDIHESHAVRSTDDHSVGCCDGLESFHEGRILGTVVHGTGEDHRRRYVPGGGDPKALLECRVGHPQQGEVDGLIDVFESRVTGSTRDLSVVGVDRIDRSLEAAGDELVEHGLAHGPGAGACPDDRDALRLEHPPERGHLAVSLYFRPKRRFRRSFLISPTQLYAGTAVTPPPAWVADEAW